MPKKAAKSPVGAKESLDSGLERQVSHVPASQTYQGLPTYRLTDLIRHLCPSGQLFWRSRSLHNQLCAEYTSHLMSSIGDKYLLGSGRSDHDRLRVISAIHDGRTRELLRKAGFVSGHRFVEFGCGLGYVTRWAASEGAHATGIDLNEDHLEVAAELAREAGLKTAQFRSANIYEPELEPESVDVSYSRWLMVHLNKPVNAMRAIHAALKPGGVMVCEEADVSAVYAEPASAAYAELRDICMEGARQRGVDYSGGRRVHLWAKEAGFEIVHVDAYHPHYVTGEHKGFWNWTLRAVALGMVKEGSLTAARLEELVAGMNEADASPDTLVAHCRMHQLIAKKPDTKI